MHTLEKSEDPDEMLHHIMLHFIRVYTVCQDKTSFRVRNTIYLENIICDSSMYSMDHPKFIISNQKEELIST